MIYDSLPRWRRPVLVLLALATVLALAQLPRLRAVFAPEELVPAAPEEQRRVGALLGPFGPEGEELLVLFESPNVLSQSSLQAQHTVALHFAEQPWVERVDGLTVTPVPHWAEPQATTATLDTLE
ncbi:MAG: hypothetical protein IT378_22255, partial [Sandaracinaceae bacterium]|nr:hypothetical protein [Sandaracinaceae bacterium]